MAGEGKRRSDRSKRWVLGGAARSLALALACCAPVIAVAVPTVRPSSVRQLEPVSASAVALAARAGSLRLFGPGATHAPAQTFSDAERRAAVASFGNLSAVDRQMLTEFLRQSRQYVDVRGNRGVTGWWSPLVGAWIVGEWRLSRSGWQLERLVPLLAEDFQPETEGPPIDLSFAGDWPNGRLNAAAALLASDRINVNGFKHVVAARRIAVLTANRARTERAQIILLAREARLRLALTQVASEPGYENYESRLADALRIDPAEGPSPAVQRHVLASLSSQVRATLEPVMAFRRPSGFSFAAQSPFAPGLIVIVHFERGAADRSARPGRIEILPLFAWEAS